MKPTLRELAGRYGCDKLYAHSYIDFYEELFSPMRDKTVWLLEIGIGYEDLMKPFVPKYVHGASLLMWRDYFEHGRIMACDIRAETMMSGMERITTAVYDQSKPRDLWDMNKRGPFDVVIDDGSHVTEHQILTGAVIVPNMYDGGVYVIEDVQEPERVAQALGGEIHRFDKRADDTLVVIRR